MFALRSLVGACGSVLTLGVHICDCVCMGV